MKRIAFVLALVVAGCGGSRPRDTFDDPGISSEAADREKKISDLKAQKSAKEQDIKAIDQELADLDRQMQSELSKPPSKEKSEQLAALSNLQREKQQARDVTTTEIRNIDQELAGLGAGPAPVAERPDPKHVDTDKELEAMLAAGKEQQDAEKRMAQQTAEEDTKKIEAANAERSAKKTAMDGDAKMIAGAGISQQPDMTYEERCAGVLAKVKAELEKYRK
jgi:hypothetical protein